VIHTYDELGVFQEMGTVSSTENRTRAYIKIQEGCNRFCSYCVIPYARGPVRSRALEDIVEEAKELIAAGYKELVLTGINTAQYDMEGRDLYAGGTGPEASDEPFGVEKAIAAINALPGEFRIRLSSLEPAVVNADYVKRLFRYEKLCHHLHMSAQSGSDKVLAAMNRPYDAKQYLEMAKAVCEFDPCFGLSTDIIVGFPGEKESDFEDSCKLVARCAFCKTHIFKYSKRPMTKAADMKEQVSPQIKQKRSEQLQKIAGQAARAFFNMNIEEAKQGRTEQVLFEETVTAPEEGAGIMKGELLLTGYTGNYIRVYIPVRVAGDSLTGRFAQVRLEENYCDGIAASVVE
jgi:threonylcarbamoyladenosine tRNA methylthiotransferase MtaB